MTDYEQIAAPPRVQGDTPGGPSTRTRSGHSFHQIPVDAHALRSRQEATLSRYAVSLSAKVFAAETSESDILMDVFGITPEQKQGNRQYWARELGMCWQALVTDSCEASRADFQPALRFGREEPCDLILGPYAIDTKYRVGSGDAGTLKKFRTNGELLRSLGYEPVLILLRSDNLPAALRAFVSGGWTIMEGEESFRFLRKETGQDLRQFLADRSGGHEIVR